MQWYLEVMKKYAVFQGRARRKEYWMFVLFNFIFMIIASFLDSVLLGTAFDGFGPLYLIYSLATFLPWWAVSVRRLHDVGKSGWFLLILLVPIVGGIWIWILACTDSQTGENKFGSSPKYA